MEGECREYRDSINSVPVGSSLLGDQKRLNHNHTQRMTKLKDMHKAKKEKLTEAKAAKETKFEEDRSRHAAEMAKLEETSKIDSRSCRRI